MSYNNAAESQTAKPSLAPFLLYHRKQGESGRQVALKWKRSKVMKRKNLYSAIGSMFLLSLLFFPLSAEAIPSLGVVPAIGEYGTYYGPEDPENEWIGVFVDDDAFLGVAENGYALPSEGNLTIWYGTTSGFVDQDVEIWLLTTSSAGDDFTFEGVDFGSPNFGKINQYGKDYFGLSLGSIDGETYANPSGLSWQTVSQYGGENYENIMDGFVGNDFYFLTGTIETPGFELDDWLFAYVPATEEKSPKTASATATVVPEPSAVLLIGTGLIGLGIFRRRFRKS